MRRLGVWLGAAVGLAGCTAWSLCAEAAAAVAPAAAADTSGNREGHAPVEPESRDAAANAPVERAEVAESEPARPRLDVGGRVMTGWENRVKHASGERDQQRPAFFLLQARVGTRISYQKRLQLKLSIDLADGLDGPPKAGEVSFVRDAWLSFRSSHWLVLTAGRFKRPWSRLQLTSAGDLPFRGRGEGNKLISKQMAYADRGVSQKTY